MRNNRATVSVVFDLGGMIELAPGAVPRVRGTGSDVDFPEKQAQLNGRRLEVNEYAADATLGNEIDFLNPLSVDWEVSLDGGQEWLAAGTTKNRIYVTLATPTDPDRFETLVDIGSRNGMTAMDPVAAVGEIWADFADREVQRKARDGDNKDDGTVMQYWDEADSPLIPQIEDECQLMTTMIKPMPGSPLDGIGTCVAWAELFKGVLETQGIIGSVVVTILPKPPAIGMLVKNWTIPNNGDAPPLCGAFTERSATDEHGVAGQNVDNPPGGFGSHFIVSYGGLYYDPSYGTGPFSGQAAYENASMDGFVRSCQGDAAYKRNDPAVVELNFQ